MTDKNFGFFCIICSQDYDSDNDSICSSSDIGAVQCTLYPPQSHAFHEEFNKTWQIIFILSSFLFNLSFIVQITTMTLYVAITTLGSALHSLFPTVLRI
jgi:hypothetical protein